MGSKWKKLKIALGLKTCVYTPRTLDDAPSSSDRFSDAVLLSPLDFSLVSTPTSVRQTPPATVPASPSKSRFSRTVSRSSSKKTCSICLNSMKQGQGHAIFTAECSHSFHFHCIASNVKHGNQICPVCRAQWKEIPSQCPGLDPPHGGARVNPVDWAQNNDLMNVIRRIPPRPDSNRLTYQVPEPSVFDDDEVLGNQIESSKKNCYDKNNNLARTIEIRTYPEVSSAPRSISFENFNVLINLKAAVSVSGNDLSKNQASRASVDLVTVLDISGSMAGTKLALLKRAMGFVIQNLGSNDRLSVIAFSSTSRRLFPLRKMSETGRQQALLAVNSLIANGGTNIADGLRKGVKVLEDRKEKNPVGSIILLSDGQDTYTVPAASKIRSDSDQPIYHSLLPSSIHGGEFKIPVHAFGFGTDHDAAAMHAISEISGGTFSFIETESVIQDAFAQCIGGILSVVVQELQVGVECLHPSLHLGSLKAGSYPTRVSADGRTAFIDIGDLYADEERNFLVSLNIPSEVSDGVTDTETDIDTQTEMSLLKVKCIYKDPLSKEKITLEGEEVKIKRPKSSDKSLELATSIEVDRQINRLKAAEAMAKARSEAEQGELAGAVSTLESCRTVLSRTVSAKSGDGLCIALDAELKEMQERMASRHVYEVSGRAYILSGLSSHSWQRATARGDSTDGSSLVRSYQTPAMSQMLTRSQALGSPSAKRLVQPKPR